ncbi:MAG TPA: tetratricopeptide repeat protein [Bacteroidota bacterium]|nr:tetratricopeptide repeat protein [Bacteroidota bacterium]
MTCRLPVGALLPAALVGLWLTGCSGSKEQEKETSLPPAPSATELMQNELLTLRTSNDSLRRENSRLEMDKQTLTIHITELESVNVDLRAKMASMVEAPKQILKQSRKFPTHAPAVTAPPPQGSLGAYSDALSTFKHRKYLAAAEMFRNLLKNGAPKGYDDNCTYWIGECLYGAKRYAEAIDQFKKVFAFEWSKKKDDAQVMIANSYLAQGDKQQARAEFEQLIKSYPASPFIRRVKEKLASL